MSLSRQEYIDQQRHKTWKKLGSKPTEKEIRRKELFIQKIKSFVDRGYTNFPVYNGDVLTVGCRDCHEEYLLRQNGFSNVYNIDIYSRNENIICMDMQDLAFKENTFKLIVSIHSLEHALDPTKTLSEFKRVLCYDGIIAIEIPVDYEPRGVDLWDFKSDFSFERVFNCKHYLRELHPPNNIFNLTNTPILRFIGVIRK